MNRYRNKKKRLSFQIESIMEDLRKVGVRMSKLDDVDNG
jgi:hypothetical protein